MKKLIFLSLFLIITSRNFAQNVNFGLKGGLNISTQNLDPNNAFPSTLNTGNLIGFNIGAIINVEYHDFTIQPGLFYTTKGLAVHQQYTSDGIFDINVVESKTKFDYIEGRVNVLYHIPVDKNTVFKIGGGPYLASGTSITISTQGNNDEHVSFDAPQAFSNSYKSLDYGINFLGEMQFDKIILIDVQYGLGLNNISNNTFFPSDHIRNRVLSISVGFLIR